MRGVDSGGDCREWLPKPILANIVTSEAQFPAPAPFRSDRRHFGDLSTPVKPEATLIYTVPQMPDLDEHTAKRACDVRRLEGGLIGLMLRSQTPLTVSRAHLFSLHTETSPNAPIALIRQVD